jgi:hypothetical protein
MSHCAQLGVTFFTCRKTTGLGSILPPCISPQSFHLKLSLPTWVNGLRPFKFLRKFSMSLILHFEEIPFYL